MWNSFLILKRKKEKADELELEAKRREDEQRRESSKNRVLSIRSKLNGEKMLREQKARQWKEEHKDLLSQRYLYNKMKEEFEVGEKISELEKRKQQLRNLRELHKPMDRDSLKSHARLYEEEQRKREKLRREDKVSLYGNSGHGVKELRGGKYSS